MIVDFLEKESGGKTEKMEKTEKIVGFWIR